MKLKLLPAAFPRDLAGNLVLSNGMMLRQIILLCSTALDIQTGMTSFNCQACLLSRNITR